MENERKYSKQMLMCSCLCVNYMTTHTHTHTHCEMGRGMVEERGLYRVNRAANWIG